MKVLVVYNSLDPHSVAGAAMAKALYGDVTLKDILAVSTGDITTWIGTLSAVYDLILINYTVTTAGTGVISPAQQILLDAKCARTVLETGTSSGAQATNLLTKTAAGWTVDAYKDMYVKTTAGTGLNQLRKILSNSTTTLTLESNWTVALDGTTTFAIAASKDDFSYYIPATSGSNKRAYCAWVHEKLFPLTPVPLFIWRLAGDKTTGSSAVNIINAATETYITAAAKYFLRDVATDAVQKVWNRLMFGVDRPAPDVTRDTPTVQDLDINQAMYDYGKLLKESATALSVSI